MKTIVFHLKLKAFILAPNAQFIFENEMIGMH